MPTPTVKLMCKWWNSKPSSANRWDKRAQYRASHIGKIKTSASDPKHLEPGFLTQQDYLNAWARWLATSGDMRIELSDEDIRATVDGFIEMAKR
jgi:hypothetical protein